MKTLLAIPLIVATANSNLPPVNRVGVCPIGYTTSGEFCVPKDNAGIALPKVGACPTGYVASGYYCIGKQESKEAILRSDRCPSGWVYKGNYCQAR